MGTKIESFNKVLSDLKPAIFGLQETKQKLFDPPIKCESMKNYQTFELKREVEKEDGGKCLSGGGLAIGVIHELKPVLTRQGCDFAECISVSVKTIPMDILCVLGYGPQLGDSKLRKDKFWEYLEEEVNTARDMNIGLIIQIDSNAWVGKNIIPGDPNKQNGNGRLLQKFLEGNPALSVVNSLECCNGLITRHRTTIHGEEKSILDMFIVCQKILPYIKHMKIDHEGNYWLTNFHAKKTNNRVTNPDHYPVMLVLDLSINISKPMRKSHFNFKDPEGQLKFLDMTDNNSRLSKIFSTEDAFDQQVVNFEKAMNSIYHQSFPKIRERKRKFKEDDIGFLIEQRKKLKLNPSSDSNERNIEDIEEQILAKTEDIYAKRVIEAIGNMTGEDGKVNNMGAWRQLNKVDPNRKKQPTLPLAFKDTKGNMITNHDNIKSHCLEKILNRLRKRPMHPELIILEQRKIMLANMRLKRATKKKSKPWTMKQMEKAIKSMKNKNAEMLKV